MTHVLLIEDDARIREIVERGLGSRGFVVTAAEDGHSGLELARKLEIDVVLLDLMLPGMSGLEVLEEIRTAKPRLPVVALTALDDTRSKVAGLDAGADDYLAKPFQTEELIARLRALIRRASGNASSELTAGDVRLDTRSGKVTLNGEPVKLTAQEYKLLSYLMHHKGKVVSRTELIEHIYDQDFDRDSNTIEVFVTRIRKKLGPDVITTIRGLGYSLEDPGR